MVFDGAVGQPRLDLVDLDGKLEARGLDLIEFARLLSRRMGWEDRGRCQNAQLVMARARHAQPIADSEYAAVQTILATSKAALRSWAPSRI
jgi:hypothetical protein